MQRTPTIGQLPARACSAKSKSISYKRENNELQLRTLSGIIAPAIYGYCGRSLLLRPGQGTRGGSIFSPSLFLPIFYHFSIYFLVQGHLSRPLLLVE
jgi:hypothetical protein